MFLFPFLANIVFIALVFFLRQSGTETPTVEWWDSVILQSDSYDDIQEGAHGSDRKSEDKFTGITYLVEHPIQMQPPGKYMGQSISQYLKY